MSPTPIGTARAAMLLLTAVALPSLPAEAAANPLGATCTATSSSTAFGTYSANSPSPTTTMATVTVNCSATVSLTVAYSVALSGGSSGRVTARTMTSGTSQLAYGLYTDTGHTSVWGDGSSGSTTVTGNAVLTTLITSQSSTLTAYGLLPAGQLAAPGSYSDSVLVTVSY